MNHHDDDDGPHEYASPPCYLHEFETTPHLSSGEIAAQLNRLLEGARAAVRGLREPGPGGDAQFDDVLRAAALDADRCCGMLAGHIERLGYPVSPRTGALYDELMQREGLQDRLSLLECSRSAEVDMLNGLLPSIDDADLRADLEEMRDAHLRTREWCARWLESGPARQT